MTTAGQHHTRTARHRRLLAAAAIATTIMAVTTGCTKEPKASSAPIGPTASPSASADPQEAEKNALIGVYRTFWDAQMKVYATGSVKDTGIEKVATDKAYSKIQATRAYYVDNGSVMKGEPVISPVISAMDMSKTPPASTITDCVDTTAYVQVNKETGEPVKTLDTKRRHVTIYTALKIGGAWQIRDLEIDRDATC
ncbi:hypothetical protein ACFWBN_31595 [Streptomyces sp. NPDC059989]|uniref:hypothetical protein n=1 Tax=Streptomyces sp. NPDC059989 TaxID=3347026 RepID=UPI0036B7E41F